ncbi:MAG: Flp pilus assembly protein CpaB [Actinobacteria bacterium]|nr:Flp pilus assembly protein CpaB [Actinomycetota bacterium]MBW3651239.1 Flp pilus assembly protein CpaB [Actinomycetota bacterium]
MGSRRTVFVVVAIVLAALAAGTTFLYVRGIEARAFNDTQLVEVFVVAKGVPKGLPGEQAIGEFVKPSRIPRKFRPATALTDPASINGKVAVTDLSVNTVLVEGQFVDPRQAQVTFSQKIPAGQVAITVSVDQVRGVAGLLVPGDKVNILVADGGSQRVLFQNVNIIAIGTTAAPQAGETAPVANPGSGLITFAVPPEAASRIAFATQQGGGIYLTLVPIDNQPSPVPPVNAGNLFTGNLTPS